MWREKAACADSTLDWFVDEHNDTVIGELVAVCETCSVARECLSDAMGHESEHADTWGVRGGLRASERRSLRKSVA